MQKYRDGIPRRRDNAKSYYSLPYIRIKTRIFSRAKLQAGVTIGL